MVNDNILGKERQEALGATKDPCKDPCKNSCKVAMILAAGFGKRMRPLTLTTPKPLIPVYDVPLIVWHILAIKAAGITDIVINTAWLADKLIGALGDGSQFGVRIHFSREAEALETAGGIRQALPILKKTIGKSETEQGGTFLLVNGDVWTTANYADIILRAAQKSVDAYLCLVDNPAHNPKGDFVIEDTSYPAVIRVKHEQEKGNTFAGVSVLHTRLFNELPEGKAPLAPILKTAMSQKSCMGEVLDARWVDVGTPERLNILDNDIRKYGATDHPAWRVLHSVR